MTTSENDIRLLKEAYIEARKSGDISTQNGSLLVDPVTGEIVSRGHNDIPEVCCDRPERRQSPLKYPWVHHAEEWAITDACRRGAKTEGLTMYATWAACAECAKSIVMSGIKRLVRHDPPEHAYPKWADSIAIGDQMLLEAGVEVISVKEHINEFVRFNGKEVLL
jgi:dCMP deaminase